MTLTVDEIDGVEVVQLSIAADHTGRVLDATFSGASRDMYVAQAIKLFIEREVGK